MVKLSRRALGGAAVAALLLAAAPARAADPIKVGFSMALTGAVAPNGKQILMRWNSGATTSTPRAGCWAARSNSSFTTTRAIRDNVPGIYTKLISVDKVDLLVGPYATNMIAPAMPVIMQNKMTIGMLGHGREPPVQLSQVFLDGAGRRRRDERPFRGVSSSSRRRKLRSRRPSRSSGPTPSSANRADGARENAEAGGFEHRLRQELSAEHHRLSRRWCAPFRPPIRISSLSPPIRPTRSASSGPRMKSA